MAAETMEDISSLFTNSHRFFVLDFGFEVYLSIGVFGVNNVSSIILQVSFFLAVVLHALVPASVDQSLF